jgi:hypothetical protein
MPLGALISHVILGKLKPYSHNRGKGVFNEPAVANCYEGVQFGAIGECTIGMYNEQLCLCGFHSRMLGFLKRHIDKKMTHAEYMGLVSVRFCEDFMETYLTSGKISTNYSLRQKVWNPDRAFGEHLETLEILVGKELIEKVGLNKSTQYACVILAFEAENKKEEVRWTWGNIYPRRSGIDSRSVEPRGSIHVTNDQLKKLADAIRSWDSFVTTFKKTAGKTNINKIITSVGFFGYYIIDHIASKGVFLKDNVKNANKILKNVTKVSALVQDLTRGDPDQMQSVATGLNEILKKR